MTKSSPLKGYHSGGHEQAVLFSNGYNRNPKTPSRLSLSPSPQAHHTLLHFHFSPSLLLSHSGTMERLANLNRLSKNLPSPVPTLPSRQAARKRSTVNEHLGLATDNLQGRHLTLQASRRAALGLASAALIGSFGNGFALAEDNGYWLTGPIPVPPIYNNIANEKTGTRSFVRNGIYIADIKVKGSMYRLRKYAFDLLALGDLIGKDALNYVRKYLRLKGTFMYYDFDKVISAASASDKQPLTDLANRLFDKFEKLEDAVKKEDLPETQSCYQDTSIILQEVMDRMA